MSRINKELYDYYIKPENINSVINIYRDFPLIKAQLIEDFLFEVNNTIRTLLTEKDWHIEFETESDDYELEIAITPNSIYSKGSNSSCWLSYWNCTNRCYLRLWLWNEFEFNYENIMKKAEDLNPQGWKLIKVKKKGDEELLWKWAPADFDVLESLETILPNNRNSLVQKFAKEMADAAISLKPLMEYIHKARI